MNLTRLTSIDDLPTLIENHDDLPILMENHWCEVLIDTRGNRFSDEKTAAQAINRRIKEGKNAMRVLICVCGNINEESFYIVER